MRNSRNVQAGGIASPLTFRSDVNGQGITVEQLSDHFTLSKEEGDEIFAAIGEAKRNFLMIWEATDLHDSSFFILFFLLFCFVWINKTKERKGKNVKLERSKMSRKLSKIMLFQFLLN